VPTQTAPHLGRRPALIAVAAIFCAVFVSGCDKLDARTSEPLDVTDTADDDALSDGTDGSDAIEECTLNAHCDGMFGELGPCRTAVCLPGSRVCDVVPVNDGTSCDDDDACTLPGSCRAGTCVGLAPVDCDDGNACTVDSCDPATGCSSVPTSGSCEDGNSCTENDTCVDGVCVSGENTCPCQTAEDCAPFEDDDLCNGTLTCDTQTPGGACVVDPATVVTCDTADDTTCMASRCDPTDGTCVATARNEGALCGAGCQVGTCADGTCVTEALECDDGNPCTDGTCYPDVGCVHLDNGSCGECVGLSCHACAVGNSGCAPAGVPTVPGTCCGVGDALVHLARGSGAEVVDVETDGTFVWLCGGFGARISKVTSPANPVSVGGASRRCQRIGIGPRLATGERVFYLAHHGDSWVSTPFLRSYTITDAGIVTEIDTIEDPSILFEGLAYRDGYLFVAAHGRGLLVYEIDPATGAPSGLAAELGGFVNAWKVALPESGSNAYVADADGGLAVVDISDPTQPTLTTSVPTSALARDVDVGGGRAYVALGGGGVDVFDITTPSNPTLLEHIDAQGSAQAVDVEGGHLAIASWSHVALHDTANFALLATEDVGVFPHFDQVLGVAMHEDILFVGEWEGLHVVQHRPGFVGPDIWIEEDLIEFDASEADAHAIVVRNRGQLDLEISNVSVPAADASRIQASPKSLRLAPGEAGTIEVVHTPSSPPSGLETTLTLETNDPDSAQSPFELFVVAGESSRIDVGDPIDDSFAFLDPSGAGQLEALRGKVVLLAYFALF